MARAVLRVFDQQLFPLVSFHIYADKFFHPVSILVDSTKAQEVFFDQKRCHIPTLSQLAVWPAPETNFLVPTSVRVELNDLLCALAHLEEYVEASAAEEIV